MKHIVLGPNPFRDTDLEQALKIKHFLEENGASCEVCPLLGSDVQSDRECLETLSEKLPHADMLVTFGGDGTILHASRLAAKYGVPILGINMGTIGFMAELELDEAEMLLEAVSGECTLENRMMLDVELVRDGEVLLSDFILNDAVIRGSSKPITLSAYSDGVYMTNIRGDGIIVATPTGSTGYSMSAGGPITEPMAESIMVTPICAHTLTIRSFVLSWQRTITVEVGELHRKDAFLILDGESRAELKENDVIRCRRSAYETKLVRIKGNNYYDLVNRKLGDRT